jgi:hypothetical protein
MTARNELALIDENVTPIDLHRAYLDACFLGTAPLRLVQPIRSRPRSEWLPHVLDAGDVLGMRLRSYYAGEADLTRALLADFGAVACPVSDFHFPAPSRHEWVAVFARELLDELCLTAGLESLEGLSPSAAYFAGERETLFSLLELKRNAARVERHFRGLQLPDERQILSDLKSELYKAAARRPLESRGRFQFYDDIRQVSFDGTPYLIPDPTPFELFKVIAAAHPHRVTSKNFNESMRLEGKNVARELHKLPNPLRRFLRTSSAGHWLILPPRKLSRSV